VNGTILYVALFLASSLAWWTFRRPILALPVLVTLSLAAGEFYPLSNYPMYSDPDGRENYFYLARIDDDDWVALPTRATTGLSAPTLKKLFKARYRAQPAAAPSRTRPRTRQLYERARAAGEETLAFLDERAAARGRALPRSTALVEVWIEWDRVSGYRERRHIVARVKAAGS